MCKSVINHQTDRNVCNLSQTHHAYANCSPLKSCSGYLQGSTSTGMHNFIICNYSQKMGQILSSDKSGQLSLLPPPLNVSQTKNYTALLLSRGIQSPFLEKVFQYENYKRLQVTYKYLPDGYVHLQLTKEKAKQEPGYPLNLGNEMVYGYKFKKNEKTQKIRPDKIYFRRKIYIPTHEPSAKNAYRQRLKKNLRNRSRTREEESSKRKESRNKSKTKETEHKKNHQTHMEELLRKLAQMKLFSKLENGVKIGRMIDGSDGVLTQHYIEFYSEVAISKCSFEEREAGERDKICENLQKKGFKVNKQTVGIAYSVFQKGYIVNQSTALAARQSDQNEKRSIKFIMREFEEEINKAINKLDGITNMMTSIQNYLSQRDVEKAMEKFEENMAVMEDSDRLLYAEQMALILGKYSSYKSYEREVSSYISSSRSSSMAQSKNLSQSRFNLRSIKSDHPEQSTDFQGMNRFSAGKQQMNGSPGNLSPRSNAPLRFSDSQSTNKAFLNSPEHDYSLNEGLGRVSYAQSNYIMWESAQERLKNSILDNDKSGISEALTCLKNLGVLTPLEVQVQFGRMLMENAKTKHAKIIFERILHTKKGGGNDFLKSQIYSMLGFLAYSDSRLAQSLSNYEKALTLKFKLRNYSRKTLLIFNNMAAICYFLQNYDKCLLYLHRGMKLGEYCADYELLMRSNYAMALAEKGQLKEAKLEMYKTYRNVEPNSNNQIVCKFYSNLGYFDLVDNLLQKAKASLDLACQIQQKFLIPNGYKFSLILHNNYAMYHYKKSQWKKAATHLKKIQSQLNDMHGMRAIQIHFNFGKVYKELDNFDTAIKHFTQARYLLMKMEEKLIVKYKEKIEQEIDKIEAQRIIEVSEESSYANKLSRISRSMLSQKPIQSKIWN